MVKVGGCLSSQFCYRQPRTGSTDNGWNRWMVLPTQLFAWQKFRRHRKRGSASYIVRSVRSVSEWVRERERERYRERRKWRHQCRAKIGDEFTLSLAKNSHLAMSVHFPLPKICTFRFSLHTSHLTLLILWHWNLQLVLTFRCQKISPSLFRLSQVVRLFFPSKKWIKLMPKTIGNRKEIVCEVALGDKHHPRKSADRKAKIRKSFVSLTCTGLICAFRSADFLGWCLSPERNLTHNLFSYFQ